MTLKEGYIKFDCDWVKAGPVEDRLVKGLNEWRNRLYALNLVGVYGNGIGFGNLSMRISESGQFVVTGNATGNLPALTAAHYSTVVGFDLERNWLKCIGPVKASSESMTHAAIYKADKSVNAVIHVHSMGLWKSLVGKVPTTSKSAAYGTPEMAKEVERLFRETNVGEKRILAMGGHEEGIISFGRSIGEAGKTLLGYFRGKGA